MTEGLSIAWTQAEATEHRIVYKRVLGANLAIYAVLSIAAIAAPTALSRLVGLPGPTEWLRSWGGLLLLVTLLYLPGFLDPVRSRWSNAVGIVGRFGAAGLYAVLGGGFLWLALGEAAFGILLAVTYFGLFRSELMSRP